MARINPALLEKIGKKLDVGTSHVYRLIGAAASSTSLPRHIAALLVAQNAGVNFARFASENDLAMLRSISSGQPSPVAASAVPAPTVRTPSRFTPKRRNKSVISKKQANAVFVVHGRDHHARKALSDFLRSVGVQPIEWSQALALTGKGSPYIGEVIDAGFSRAKAIVVLFTPDDEAKLRDKLIRADEPTFERKLSGQPRQNVLFEAGMAFGRYAATTILVQIGKVRQMSDVTGLHIVHLTGSESSRRQLIGKLKTTGVTVDDSGEDWLTTGDFA